MVPPGPERVHRVHNGLVFRDDFADVALEELWAARCQRLALEARLVRPLGFVVTRLAALVHRLILEQQQPLWLARLDRMRPRAAVFVQVALGFERETTRPARAKFAVQRVRGRNTIEQLSGSGMAFWRAWGRREKDWVELDEN